MAIDTFAEELLKTMVEEGLPPARILIIVRELSEAFADGAVEALNQVNNKLSVRYERDIVTSGGSITGGITEEGYESLKDIQRWQANSLAEFPGIVMGGMTEAAKKALEIVAREITIWAVKEPMEKLADRIGEMAIDILKGEALEEAAEPAAYHTAKKAIEKITEVIEHAFIKAAFAVGFPPVLDAVSEAAFRKEAEGAGFSSKAVGRVAREVRGAKKLTFDNLHDDVHENVVAGRLAATGRPAATVPSDLKEFDESYAELTLLVGKYTAMGRMGRAWDWADADRLRTQMAEPYNKAMRALAGLQMSAAGLDDETLFDADRDLLQSTVGDLVGYTAWGFVRQQ